MDNSPTHVKGNSTKFGVYYLNLLSRSCLNRSVLQKNKNLWSFFSWWHSKVSTTAELSWPNCQKL